MAADTVVLAKSPAGSQSVVLAAPSVASGFLSSFVFDGRIFGISQYYHTTSTLPDGRVLLAGGIGGSQTETYLGQVSGNTITWTASTPLPLGKYAHTASTLPDGRVLLTGGAGGAQTETYLGQVSGNTITWTASTPLPLGKNAHTASTLPDGRVLLTGGISPGSASQLFVTSGLTSGKPALAQGDWLTLDTAQGKQLVLIASDTFYNASGKLLVFFSPPLRSAVFPHTPALVKDTFTYFKAENLETGWSNEGITQGGFSMRFVEDWGL
jgi:hypothetical protein